MDLTALKDSMDAALASLGGGQEQEGAAAVASFVPNMVGGASGANDDKQA